MKIYLFLIITAILWGTSPILEKVGLTGGKGTSPFIALTVRSIPITVILLSILLFSSKFKQEFMTLSARNLSLFVLSGILAGLLGMLTYFAALKLGAPSKIVPLAATYPMVAAILGMTVLNEQVSLVRFLGIALIIAGIWLVR